MASNEQVLKSIGNFQRALKRFQITLERLENEVQYLNGRIESLEYLKDAEYD